MDPVRTKLIISSLCRHPKRFWKEHSLIALSPISIRKGSRLLSDHSIIRKSKISITGDNNLLDVGKADIYNSSISIAGADNHIRIREGVRIYNMNIVIKKARNSFIEIGAASHLGGGTVVCAGDDNYIRIGESCMIAEDVEIWNSDTHVITIQGKDVANSRPIAIGNHVWLGKGVTVLKGVTIGDNVVVGMKSVVTRDLRACTINAGIPAKEIQDNINWHK